MYFFCKDRSLKQQTLKTFMMVFIMQLSQTKPECMKKIQEARSRNERSLTDADYIDLIKAMLAYFRKVIVVVDALDESVQAPEISEAFGKFRNPALITTEILIFVTSREEIKIERLIAPLVTNKLCLSSRTEADIRRYVAAEVDRRIDSRSLKLRDPGLATEIVRSLVDSTGGLYVSIFDSG